MKNPAAERANEFVAGYLRSRRKSPTDFSHFILGVCYPAIIGRKLNRPKAPPPKGGFLGIRPPSNKPGAAVHGSVAGCCAPASG
jgi:hypothetical protein